MNSALLNFIPFTCFLGSQLPLHSRRKLLTLLAPLNPFSKEINLVSFTYYYFFFFTAHQNPRDTSHPWSPLGNWHEIKPIVIPSVAQSNETDRAPCRFSIALLPTAAVSESSLEINEIPWLALLGARSLRHGAASAKPPEAAWLNAGGCVPVPEVLSANLTPKREVTPVCVLPSPDQRRARRKCCQRLLRGFALLNLANTNKHLRAELAQRALAFGLLTNELPLVKPFNFIKLPRQFQLKARVKRHTAVFSKRPHQEKAYSSV